MIEVKDLCFSFGANVVLKDVSFSVEDGCVLGIVGINGAGKSTLLRSISGVLRPEGTVLYDGRSPESAETRQDIFFLPDDPYYERGTRPDTLFGFYRTFYPDIDREKFDSLLSVYGIKPKGHLRNFSKGMRRQVFVALALSIKPKYLLLDEAFDGLDPLSRKIFKDAIRELVRDVGSTVLVTSHSLLELEDFCDSYIMIDKNTITSTGSTGERRANVFKFALAFSEPKDEAFFAPLSPISLEIKGRFADVVLEGEREEITAKLDSLGALLTEELPLDFEATFIHDVLRNRGEENEKK